MKEGEQYVVRVSPDGKITLPDELKDKLGPNSIIHCEAERGKIVLKVLVK